MLENIDIDKYSKVHGEIDNKHPEWVHIGKYVIVGSESRILTHGPIRPFYENPHIYIEDLVWIGFRCIILPGVKIGKATIIGAGSVVTKDTEPYSIYGGNLIKFIRYQTPKETLRSFVVKWLMGKTMGYVKDIDWKLLTKDHINYIFDNRNKDMTLKEILNNETL